MESKFELKTKSGMPASRNLVFTSAGDNANLLQWVEGKQDFDLWVTYYGDNGTRYSDVADFYNVHKGGKFPNLLFAFQNWRQIFDAYDSIFVLDDDIVFNSSALERLFKFSDVRIETCSKSGVNIYLEGAFLT